MSDQKEHSKLDKALKRALEGIEPTYEPADWADLEQRLMQVSQAKKFNNWKKLFLNSIVIGSVAAGAACFNSFYLNSNNPTAKTNHQIINAHKEQESDRIHQTANGINPNKTNEQPKSNHTSERQFPVTNYNQLAQLSTNEPSIANTLTNNYFNTSIIELITTGWANNITNNTSSYNKVAVGINKKEETPGGGLKADNVYNNFISANNNPETVNSSKNPTFDKLIRVKRSKNSSTISVKRSLVTNDKHKTTSENDEENSNLKTAPHNKNTGTNVKEVIKSPTTKTAQNENSNNAPSNKNLRADVIVKPTTSTIHKTKSPVSDKGERVIKNNGANPSKNGVVTKATTALNNNRATKIGSAESTSSGIASTIDRSVKNTQAEKSDNNMLNVSVTDSALKQREKTFNKNKVDDSSSYMIEPKQTDSVFQDKKVSDSAKTAVAVYLKAINEATAVIAVTGSAAGDNLLLKFWEAPGYTGAEERHTINMLYKNKWLAAGYGPADFAAGYDGNFGKYKNNGIGLYYTHTTANISLKKAYGFSYSYKLSFNTENKIRIGLGGAYVQKSINWAPATYYTSYNTGVKGLTGEPKAGTTVSYFDFNAGLWYTYKRFYLNFSALHITQPDESYIKIVTSPLPRDFYLSSGYKFLLSNNWSVTPALFIRNTAGLYTNYTPLVLVTFKEKVFVGGNYTNLNLLTIQAGGVLFDALRFTVSGGIPTTKNLKPFGNPSGIIEAGIRYQLRSATKSE